MSSSLLDEESYVYDESAMAAAWRLYMNSGVVDESVVRPMIARSWRRARAAGVNPWSLDFPPSNNNLLREKRKAYAHSIEANEPIMQVLAALLNCNVSLMDQENFVLAFETPLPNYPRTKGTFQHESIQGTGNSTVVAYERRPVRIDGFEHYRSVSHGYSGVSSPFLDVNGEYFGALNLNSPYGMLPPQALDMCTMGVSLSNELFTMGRGVWSRLRSTEFFQPLVDMMSDPVAFLDERGNLLLVNDAMKPLVPGFEDRAYGECSLSVYLDRKSPLKSVVSSALEPRETPAVYFKAPRKKEVRELLLANRTDLRLHNGMHFLVLVFKDPLSGAAEQPALEKGFAKRRVTAVAPPKGMTCDYIGETPEWKEVDAIVKRVATVNANAFILGETGTGKELVARAIHRLSGRSGPFIAINCGAIPRDLFAAELFGYEPGAFTGAKEEGSVGKIEAANHGTVLLDEIGEMPLDLQVGLLRVIQEQGVTRLGATEPRPLDVRFLAATNQDVARMIEDKQFRADLYYRLSSIEINLPPLRRRADDVPLLIEHFNRRFSESLCLEYSPFSAEVVDALRLYTWPGNVRELSNIVERCLIMAGTGDKVTLSVLPAHLSNTGSKLKSFVPANLPDNGPEKGGALQDSGGVGVASSGSGSNRVKLVGGALSDAELMDRDEISRLLLENGGNLSKVAAQMGISRTTLYKRIEQYHLRVRLVVEVDDEYKE